MMNTSKTSFSKTLLAAAIISATMPISAQEQEPDNSSSDNLDFEQIIVTGVARGQSKLETSVSVSTISPEEYAEFAPRSTSEIFRNLPGIRSESTGGESNINLIVRGMPQAPGSKYVQLHEDGLPVLQFGDIAFGNVDIFLRADSTVSTIESIRGGSSSTFASNSPGGLINFISKTGDSDGGSIGLTLGVDFDSFRTDFEYGGEINNDTYFHIGGFFREGDGPKDVGFNSNSGGQIKANLTRTFDNGYVRFYFKHLNDRTITYLPGPTLVTGSDGSPSTSDFAGFNILEDSLHSINHLNSRVINRQGEQVTNDVRDGVSPTVTSFGVEFDFDFNDDWNIVNRARITSAETSFISPFYAGGAQPAQQYAEAIGGPGASLVYASGPNVGESFSAGSNANGLASDIIMFDTDVPDVGSFNNDLKINGQLTEDISLTLGYYKARQDVEVEWRFVQYASELVGEGGSLLDVIDANGNAVTDRGLVSYSAFGGCCQRYVDAQYDIDAYYANLNWVIDDITIDASVRYDDGDATGFYSGANLEGDQSQSIDLNRDGNISPYETGIIVLDNGPQYPINYDWNEVSWSIGANYIINDNLAVFARASSGSRVRADRLLWSPLNQLINRDGTAQGAVDEVEQFELGLKYSAKDFGLFVTAFTAETDDQNADPTLNQTVFARTYDSSGIEFEGVWQISDHFDVTGSFTLTDAEISSDSLNPANVGKEPAHQASWIFNLTPAYTSDNFRIGMNFIGSDDSFTDEANVFVLKGYIQSNFFATYYINDYMTVSVNMNNAFNEVGISESAGVPPSPNVDGFILSQRGIYGRTTTATLRYEF
jgi:outer membrane receptor protein involved in Fe transport